MTHDPICPQGEGASISTTPYGLEDFPCLCELIAKVRGDERRKAEIHTYHQPAWTAGFEAALDAAREAVMTAWRNWTGNDNCTDHPCQNCQTFGKAIVVTVALREEKP